MRLLLWLSLVVLCAVSGDHVLAVVAGLLLLTCADDQALVLRKPAARRWFGRNAGL